MIASSPNGKSTFRIEAIRVAWWPPGRSVRLSADALAEEVRFSAADTGKGIPQEFLGRVFERCDVVLTPTTAKPPPRIGALEGEGYWKTGNTASATCPFAFAWNVVGWPGISVPAGFTSTGLPIGAQLLGRENDEATLLSLAGSVERAEGGWPRPSR